jgi:hypothetical protein
MQMMILLVGRTGLGQQGHSLSYVARGAGSAGVRLGSAAMIRTGILLSYPTI